MSWKKDENLYEEIKKGSPQPQHVHWSNPNKVCKKKDARLFYEQKKEEITRPPQHVPWLNPNEVRASHKPAKGHMDRLGQERHKHKQMNQPSTESSGYHKKHGNFSQKDEGAIAIKKGVLSNEEEWIKGATDGHVPGSNPNEWRVSNKLTNTAHGTSCGRHVRLSLRRPDDSPGAEALGIPVHHPNVCTERRRVPIDCVFPGAVREGGLNNREGNEEDDEGTIVVGYGEEDGTIEPSPPDLSAELVDPVEEERLRQEQIKQAVKKELQKAVLVGAVVPDVVPVAISNRGRRWKLVGAFSILILILIVLAVVLGMKLSPGDQTSTQASTSTPTQAPTTSEPSHGGGGGSGGGGGGENGVVYGLQPSCNSINSDKYNICLDLESLSGSYESWMEAFDKAKQKWENIIVGNLPSFSSSELDNDPQLRCMDYPSTIDDIYLCGRETSIDGPGGVLGSASPIYTRGSGIVNPRTGEEYDVTFTGLMEFDAEDIAELQGNGEFNEVVFHEMAHVLGAGTLWVDNGLYVGGSGEYATGTHADDEWKALGCSGPLPVELDGGQGTADGHWDEECLQHEIMSGFLSGSAQPISRITVGAFEDMGYLVDYSQADSFFSIGDLGVCGSNCPEARRGLRQREHKLKAKLDKHGEDAVMLYAKTKLNKMHKEFEIAAALHGDHDDGIKAVEELHVLYKDAGGCIHGVHVTWNEVKDLPI